MKLFNCGNLKKLFTRTQYALYCEIHNDHMILGLLESIKNKYRVQEAKFITLNNVELSNGIIVNHSAITQHIADFLHHYKLHKPRTILCMPTLTHQPSKIQPWATLQTALCIARSPVRLEAIITQSPLPTGFDSTSAYSFEKSNITRQQDLLTIFKGYNPHAPSRWITYSLATALLAVIALSKMQTTVTKNKEKTCQEHVQLDAQVKDLEKKVKALHQLNQETSELSAKISTLKNLKKYSSNPSVLLVTIANSIPTASWLTTIKISTAQEQNPQKQQAKNPPAAPQPARIQNNKQKIKLLELEGFSYKTQEVTQFIKNLQKSPSIKNLSLAKLSKEQKDPQQAVDQYCFKIVGNVIT